MNLRLVNASGLAVGSTINESTSSIDNVEHVFLRNLPAGQYALEVNADTNNEDLRHSLGGSTRQRP